ncbi:MAG: hypothetical protein LW817_08215, partial [Candidatus Caenarcaniphilales bacterium]|nr:hypothetical protein [Candidatus Caenarcaniphilales bacterium]
MYGIQSSGFNNFSLGNFKALDAKFSKQFIEYYSKFTKDTEQFRKMNASIATDLTKLKEKFKSNPSEGL